MTENHKEQKKQNAEERIRRILIFLLLPYRMLDRPEEKMEKKALTMAAVVLAACFLLSLVFPGILRLLCVFGYVAVLVLSWMLLSSRNENP